MSTNGTEAGRVSRGEDAGGDDSPVLLRIHLRGGQTIEKVVTDWGVKKGPLTNELTELRWHGADDGTRMPYVRLDAVDAITAVPVSSLTPGEGK